MGCLRRAAARAAWRVLGVHETSGSSLWRHILREQIDVSEAEFWACVKDGVKPRRGRSEAPKDAIPLEVAQLLIHKVGLSEAELAELTHDEAIARLNKYRTEPA